MCSATTLNNGDYFSDYSEAIANSAGSTHWQRPSAAVVSVQGYRPEDVVIFFIPPAMSNRLLEIPELREYQEQRGEALPEIASERTLTVDEMVTRIQNVLGLTAAQVAQCVGVSRPALYKHLNNETPRDIEAYYRLYNLSVRIEGALGRISKRHKTVLVDGKTFVRHLTERKGDEEYLLGIASQVIDRLKGSESDSHALTASEQRLVSRSVTRGV